MMWFAMKRYIIVKLDEGNYRARVLVRTMSHLCIVNKTMAYLSIVNRTMSHIEMNRHM